MFWKTMKPFCSQKNIATKQIKIKESEKFITDDSKLSNEKLSFKSAVKSLNIHSNECYLTETADLSDPVKIVLTKLQNYSIILTIHTAQKTMFSNSWNIMKSSNIN